MIAQGQVGPAAYADGNQPGAGFRQGRLGEIIASELHGRFFEQAFRSNLYSIGGPVTALSANTITLTATTTPIIGVWNPMSSPVNLVILQAALQVAVQAASSTAQGGFVWASSAANAAIATGSAPFNRKSLNTIGSQAKGFPGGVALTGLSNNLVVFEGADLAGGLAITTAAVPGTSAVPTTAYVQNFDGSLIIPPGGVLALLNTISTTNLSVAARLLWEEVAL